MVQEGVEGSVVYRHAAPLHATALRSSPPTLVFTAGFDLLRDEGDAYACRLADAKAPVAHRCWSGTNQGFRALVGWFGKGDSAMQATSDWLRVIRWTQCRVS